LAHPIMGARVDGFWLRLKQRKLVQWSAAYIAGSFALIQVLDVVAQRFGWPDRIEKLVILALAVGFFVTLVLAWYHGDRGAQRIGGTELLIIALLLAIGGGGLWVYARAPAQATIAVAKAGVRSPDAAQRNPGEGSAAPPDSAAGAASSGLPDVGVAEDIPGKSVAVLPFANESGNKDEQFFSDGLSEDLITALSQFAGLKVISRNSAFQFRDSKDSSARIGKLLGVAHLLEGSVQRAGDEVRITATLVNAADGSILWSQRYDKPYKDLFALQDAITQAVADALKAKLLTTSGAVVQSDRPPSGNLAAYTAYQHGKAYEALVTDAGDRQAVKAFTKAIRFDPKYAAAYAQLSFTWVDLASQFVISAHTQQANTEARRAADAALKLDADSSLAHQARANVLQYVDMNWSGAEAEAERALQLAPNDAAARFSLARILASLGQNRRAADLTRQALANDPRHALWYSWLSMNLAALGQLDEAKRAIETAITLQPGAVRNHERLTIIEILRGDPKAALTAAQKELPPWHDIAVAMALQTGTDRTAADVALKQLIAGYSSGAPYQIAQVYALRGDADNAFKWLNRGWSNRDPGIGYLLMDPLILRYRDDPRFAAFCEKVGLPTTTDAVAMR
jgi:TolB-like protein/Flp pilus assembly protein TadD